MQLKIMLIIFWWNSSKCNARIVWINACRSCIIAVKFCPCLFQDYGPNFFILRFAENRFTRICFNWNIVINDNGMEFAIDIHLDNVNTRSIDFVSWMDKKVFDPFFLMCQWCKDCHEEWVTTFAWQSIIYTHFVEKLMLWIYFTESFPLDILEANIF